jgi:Fe-S cluster assembly iron-binding protein IscA
MLEAAGVPSARSDMPSITTRATTRLIEDRKRRGLPDTFAPRLSRREGRIVLDFATKPAPDDRVSTTDGMSLFVASDVAEDIDNTVVDIRTRDGRERLVLLRTRAEAS